MQGVLDRLGVQPGASMADVMARHRGMGPGFDFIRIALSSLIFYLHCQWLVGAAPIDPVAAVTAAGRTAQRAAAATGGVHFDWQWPVHEMLVPMFFAVSGFLVTGSAIRLRKTPTFLWFRVLRLLPALVTEVTLSALILGPALTAFSRSAYFGDPAFSRYFLNIVGDVHFFLPGLFKSNPVDVVNVNLWTLPAEFYCYAFTTVGMLTTVIYRPRVFTAALVLASAVLIPFSVLTGYGANGTGFKTWTELVYYFFVGVAFYHWRDRIPLRMSYFIAAAVISYALVALGQRTTFIAPVFICYTILFVGMLAIPRIPLLQRGDYSYGIYLYGFPICQAVMATVPGLRGHSRELFLVAFPATLLFAIASWHMIEKPALRLKKAFARKVIPVDPSERVGSDQGAAIPSVAYTSRHANEPT